jgi:branched-chain amino acid transport system ATP-binding protein
VLELRDLHVAYGAIRALNGVNLRVDAGELVALIGSNGAGKSTTLKAISGLLRTSATPRQGTITFEGADITRAAPDRIVALGISHCPEGRRIFSGLTVRENLLVGAVQRKGDIQSDLEWTYDLFPILKERLSQNGGTLSGGEQQMLAIARALMSRPKLLLLDEPSLGLAPLLVQRIFEVIAELKSKGTTMLLVEQNIHHALEVADRAYVMETGQVTLSGPAEELRHNPQVEQSYLGQDYERAAIDPRKPI